MTISVLIATAVAFVLGGTYYAVLGDRLAVACGDAGPDEPPPVWTFAVELVRCLVLSAVVAGLASEAGIDDVAGGLALGAVLWTGFPFVLWVGAVVHERTPVALAAIHAGDWLAKLLAVAVIVSVI
jgi:Protein of unknown function (DUF1761)